MLTDEARAAGRLKLATERLAGKYPFHGAVLRQLAPTAVPVLETMGVSVKSAGAVNLFYSPEFVLSITLPELVGVLLHEVCHVVLGHIYTPPSDYADASGKVDEQARVVAEEVTVNEFVSEPLPGGATLLADYPQLSPKQSTRDRYRILKGTVPKDTCALDDHSGWLSEDGGEGSGISQADVADAVEDLLLLAAGEVGGEIPHSIAEAIRSHGITPGSTSQKITKSSAPSTVSWQKLLRRYISQFKEPDRTRHRPNKRLPSLVGIVPGRYRKPHKPRVFAVIDTSGSITEQLLSAINREVARVAREFEVIVAECDSKVHAIYPYREIKEVRGRGGTNLQAPFAPEILSQVGEFSVLIYFTDGYGPAPPRAPRFPVIWCIVPGGIAPANWGRVIEMGAP